MANKLVKKKTKPKARASVEVMIRRYKAKLAKMKRVQALNKIKEEVRELQELIKKGF